MIGIRIRSDGERSQAQYQASHQCGWRGRWVVGRSTAEAHERAHLTTVDCGVGPVMIGHYVPGSPDWHQARMVGLGGSEVAAVLGLSPWESHFSLWHRKSGAYSVDEASDEMTAGTLLEPVIRRKFAERHPGWSVRPNAGTWRSRETPFQLANPDGLVSIPAGGDDPVGPDSTVLLETKFSLYADGFGEEGTDEIPVYYRCQVQWYLDVFGLEVAYVMVFIGSCAAFREYVVRADPEEQARLRDAGAAFMASLASGQRPPIDGHDATYQVIKALHPDIDGGSLPVPVEIAEPFCRAKHAEAAAKLEAKRATAVLADAMGAAQYATFAGQRIARRQAKGDGTPFVVAERHLPFGEVTHFEEKAS